MLAWVLMLLSLLLLRWGHSLEVDSHLVEVAREDKSASVVYISVGDLERLDAQIPVACHDSHERADLVLSDPIRKLLCDWLRVSLSLGSWSCLGLGLGLVLICLLFDFFSLGDWLRRRLGFDCHQDYGVILNNVEVTHNFRVVVHDLAHRNELLSLN